jgi:hypothetical protein
MTQDVGPEFRLALNMLSSSFSLLNNNFAGITDLYHNTRLKHDFIILATCETEIERISL